MLTNTTLLRKFQRAGATTMKKYLGKNWFFSVLKMGYELTS